MACLDPRDLNIGARLLDAIDHALLSSGWNSQIVLTNKVIGRNLLPARAGRLSVKGSQCMSLEF